MAASRDGASGRHTLDPELARRVAALSLRARKTVDGLLTGIHRSPHRGASVVFVEHREYRPGDDPRLLDWRAYGRTDRHSIKRFEQETQLRATLVLDRSGSMDYGRDPSKVEHAANLLAALAYLLIRQGDAAGAAAVDHEIRELLLPRSRPAHLEAVLRVLGSGAERGRRTDLGASLGRVAERAGRRGVVIVASDLLDLSDGALQPLSTLVSRGNDVIVLHVLHPHELELPFDDAVRFVGLEGEDPIDVDPRVVRASYRREMDAFVESCRRRCATAGTRYAMVRTDEAPEHALAALLATQGRGGWG